MAKKRILVVDDEESIGNTLKAALEKTGRYEVKVETKGANALEATRSFRPDIVLLDVMMPDADGGEVACRIKADSAVKDTPIVFLTAAITKKEAASQASNIGDYPFIAKPVSVEEIIDHIEKNAR